MSNGPAISHMYTRALQFFFIID